VSKAHLFKAHFVKVHFLKTHFSQSAIFLKRISLKAPFFKAGIVSKQPFQERSCEATRQRLPLNVPVTAQILNRQIELRANG
jgi:hypothetical protein